MDRTDRCDAVTRRAALGLLSGIFLANAAAGCSPGGPALGRSAGGRDRLKEMRALRGTGDPRRRGGRAPNPAGGKFHG